MWILHLKTGVLSDGIRSIRVYSGAPGATFNNPDMTSIHNAGSIPLGEYTIGKSFTDPIKGSFVMRLTPKPGTNTFGRAGFEIHGDSISKPGHASEGCIVTCGPMQHEDRVYIDSHENKDLEVVAT